MILSVPSTLAARLSRSIMQNSQRHTTTQPRALRSTKALARALCAAMVLTGAFATPAAAQSRPDQVYVLDKRSGAINMLPGIVEDHGLVETIVLRGGKKRTYDTWRVERIVWGTVSGSFREGRTYFERSDFENAAAKFLVAATNDQRPPVQAAARLLAAQSYLHLASTNPDRLSDAIEQAERYIDDHPEGAGLPTARTLLARATWLSGDAAAAAQTYRDLFAEASADELSPGYSLVPCLRAGLLAARANLAAGETLPARELYTTLLQRANSAISALEEDSRERGALARLALEARAGEGFVLIASQQNKQAITFFESVLSSVGKTESALRYASLLGLGEAQAAEQRLREAQLNFARVSSIDHTDRDRVARALYRLAESTRDLSDPGSTGTVRNWLETVSADYGDTPWAAPARKLLESM